VELGHAALGRCERARLALPAVEELTPPPLRAGLEQRLCYHVLRFSQAKTWRKAGEGVPQLSGNAVSQLEERLAIAPSGAQRRAGWAGASSWSPLWANEALDKRWSSVARKGLRAGCPLFPTLAALRAGLLSDALRANSNGNKVFPPARKFGHTRRRKARP
jgi:hypothetical protein